MDRRRIAVFLGLIFVVGLVAALTYYDSIRTEPEGPIAFAPAQSTDESVPAGETPIEPPASVVEAPTPDEPTAATDLAETPPVEPAKAPSDATDVAAAEPPPTPAEEPEVAMAPVVEPPEAAEPPMPAEPELAAETPTEPAPGEAEVAMAPDAADGLAEPEVAEIAGKEPVAPAGPESTTVVPTFDVVRVETSGETVIAGQAEPEAKVEVLDGPTAVATAEANARGEWALALDEPLPPGAHDLAIRTTSKDLGVTVLSDERVAVSVPEESTEDVLVVLNAPGTPSTVLQMPDEPPALGVAPAPEVAAVPGTEPGGMVETEVAVAEPTPEPSAASEPGAAVAPSMAPEVAVVAPAEPSSTPPASADSEVAMPAEVAEPPTPSMTEPAVTVAAVEADTSGGLYIAGTAETGAPVRIYLDNEPMGEATPSPTGTWLLEARRELPAGTYQVRADQLDEATGEVVARAEVSFEREVEVATLQPTATTGAAEGTRLSGAAELETVIIKRGDNLWTIARRLYGHGIRYSTIYQANKDQIRNPHWIYPGQVFVIPVGNTAWQN